MMLFFKIQDFPSIIQINMTILLVMNVFFTRVGLELIFQHDT